MNNLKKIKMVVVDIDGTILPKNFQLSENVKKSFKKLVQNGIKTILATGRMYCAAYPIAKELGLVEPIISYQGAYVRSFQGDVLRDVPVDIEIGLDVIKEIKQRDIHVNVYSNDILYVEQDNELIRTYCRERDISYSVVDDFRSIATKGYHKILAIDSNSTKISSLINDLSNTYKNRLYVTHSTPYFCEVSNINATKGKAIEFLSQKYNISKDEIFAAGDQNNDIALLAHRFR